MNDENVIVCASYFAANSDYSSYRNHFEKLLFHTQSLKSGKISVFGYYNLPKVSWFSDPLHFLPLEYINPNMRNVLQDLVHLYSELDFIQHLSPLPNKGYTLDLLFSQHDLIVESPFDLVRTDVHHVSTFATINIISSTDQSVSTYKDFKNADYVTINRNLLEIDWNNIFIEQDLEANVDKFNCILNSEISKPCSC